MGRPAVVITYNDATADTDHDGITNAWEDRFGLNRNNPADGAFDSDGDRMSNREEFLADTEAERRELLPEVDGREGREREDPALVVRRNQRSPEADPRRHAPRLARHGARSRPTVRRPR